VPVACERRSPLTCFDTGRVAARACPSSAPLHAAHAFGPPSPHTSGGRIARVPLLDWIGRMAYEVRTIA